MGNILCSCDQCGSKFFKVPSQIRGRNFCSKQCYGLSFVGKEPHNKGKRTLVEKPCKTCGSLMVGTPAEIARKKFCSKACFGASCSNTIEDQLKKYQVIEPEGCWIWEGTTRGGYGRFGKTKGDKKLNFSAHRESYKFHVGEIPDDLVIDHLCRNRACINPKHMELVTNAENIRRGEAGKGPRSEAHKLAVSIAGKRRFNDPVALEAQRKILINARNSPKWREAMNKRKEKNRVNS